jgi:hypothetical protein
MYEPTGLQVRDVERMILLQVGFVGKYAGERLSRMNETAPHLSVDRIFVSHPVSSMIVNLSSFVTVLVGADVRSEISDQMGPVPFR